MPEISNYLKAFAWSICVLSLSFTQAQIRSSNAGTYITIDVTPGKYHFVHIPFTAAPDEGVLTPSALFAGVSNVPVGTTIVFYDNTNQLFQSNSETLFAFGWFPNVADLSFKSFWLLMPASADPAVPIHLSGSVPSSDTRPSFSKFIQEPQPGQSQASNYIGNDYPVEQLWVNSDLAAKARIGDTLFQYDASVGGFYGSTTRFSFGWFPNDLVLTPGHSYLYYSTGAGALTWDEIKPYAWP